MFSASTTTFCLKLVGSKQTVAIQPSGGGGVDLPEAILLTTAVLAVTQYDVNGVSH
ncbi:hypothetical protein NKJ06_16340 [Mesorhizobium sp. M0293]|uniref:hypothetical protein n=1 Tax=unclassified Mesorhizobium TaxID=325217 RepID=UPI00333BF6D0